MTDSSSFSSLLALVDSHLSNINIQESRSEDSSNVTNRFPIPSFSQTGTFSDSKLSLPPGQRLPIPSFHLGESPIQTRLAEQVANMLRAKELKKQKEEEKRVEEEARKKQVEVKCLQEEAPEDDCVIDLMQALQMPCDPPIKKEVLSSSSSFESIFEPKFIDCDYTPHEISPEPLLPCKTDMSYILNQKVHRGKCSSFGKVLTSRLRPVAAPYFKEKIENTIVPFDFSTPSPCDINKEKLRRPTTYCTYQPDIFSIF